MPDRLLLDERILADGSVARTYASRSPAGVRIEDDAEPGGELSVAALDRVMTRYGRALDPDVVLDGDQLALDAGHALRHLRFHAIVDAEARDYLVWERPGHEPLAVVARHATGALRYLVLRLAEERSQ